MRSLYWLSLIVALPLGAQQQDSTARRDSAMLEREARRIRGEATSRVPERTLQPGEGRRARWSVAVGALSGATWLESADGVEVRSGVAPALAGEVAWPRGGALAYLVSLRASRASITVEDEGSWDGEAIVVADLLAGALRGVSERVTVRGAVGAAYVAGGGEVAPFSEASRIAPAVELGAEYRLPTAVPLALGLAAQALRYGSGGTAPQGAATGTVFRFGVELRHGR